MVSSPNDKPTGCVASGRVGLPVPSAAKLLRGAQIEAGGWRHTGSESDNTSGSLVCDANHVVYHSSSAAALSAGAVLRDIAEDCHIVWKAARHQEPTDGSLGADWADHCPVTETSGTDALLSRRSICSITERAEELQEG